MALMISPLITVLKVEKGWQEEKWRKFWGFVSLMCRPVSRIPFLSNLFPLKILRSRKLTDVGELVMVNLIVDIWLFKWRWNSHSSSVEPVQIMKMSSMYRSQMVGWVPLQSAKAFSSKLAMKRLARCGAHLVPIATPLLWV